MVDDPRSHVLRPLLDAWKNTPVVAVDHHLDIVDRTASFDSLFGLSGNVLHALLTRKAFAACDSRFDDVTGQLSRILAYRADRDLDDPRFDEIYTALSRDAPRFDRWSGSGERAIFLPCDVELPVRMDAVEFTVYLMRPIESVDVELLAFVPADRAGADRLARLFDEIHPAPDLPRWW